MFPSRKARSLTRMACCLLLLCVLFSVSVSPALAGEAHIRLRSVHIKTVSVSLSFQGSSAVCNATAFPKTDSDVSMTLILYKKSGNFWTRQCSWSGSASNGNSLWVSGTAYVTSGTYKLVASGTMGDESFRVETQEKTH